MGCNESHMPALQQQFAKTSLNLAHGWVITSHNFIRADSRLAPIQWEMALFCNDVSHWLGANLESALFHEWHNLSMPIKTKKVLGGHTLSTCFSAIGPWPCPSEIVANLWPPIPAKNIINSFVHRNSWFDFENTVFSNSFVTYNNNIENALECFLWEYYRQSTLDLVMAWYRQAISNLDIFRHMAPLDTFSGMGVRFE